MLLFDPKLNALEQSLAMVPTHAAKRHMKTDHKILSSSPKPRSQGIRTYKKRATTVTILWWKYCRSIGPTLLVTSHISPLERGSSNYVQRTQDNCWSKIRNALTNQMTMPFILKSLQILTPRTSIVETLVLTRLRRALKDPAVAATKYYGAI